jgi:four helix bundle protein
MRWLDTRIVQGFALRKYKNEYIHYLYRAYASCEETIFHVEELFDSGSMPDPALSGELVAAYRSLSGKLFAFIQAVERGHQPPQYLKEPDPSYSVDLNPES